MADNDKRNEYTDSLSEMLGKNRERKMMAEKDSHKDDLSEAAEKNDGLSKSVGKKNGLFKFVSARKKDSNADKKTKGAFLQDNDEDIHDIDFDDQDELLAAKKTSRRIREAEKQLKRQNRIRKTVIQIILGIVVSGFVLFFGVKLGYSLYDAVIDYTGINTNEFQVVVDIPENPTLEQVVDVLKANGIITNTDFFTKYVESKYNDDEFVGGEFTLSSSMNYGTIVDTLLASKNAIMTVEVTIIEGMTAVEVGELLEKNFVCRAEDFLKFYRDKLNVYDFERRVLENSHKFNQMEGYLFPDKYEFYVCNELKENPEADIDTTSDAEVAAKKIYSNFNSKITKAMYKQMNAMGLTLDELITLASMVQSEVNNTEDMKTVASVFLNRLAAGGDFSKLQSDVTVFYVQDYIEPYYNDYDLETSLAVISNSYDTYECDGIPAGPICNPGLDAINAVLNAYDTEYYYFCANEETGETFYGRTLEEHQENLVKAGLVQ